MQHVWTESLSTRDLHDNIYNEGLHKIKEYYVSSLKPTRFIVPLSLIQINTPRNGI